MGDLIKDEKFITKFTLDACLWSILLLSIPSEQCVSQLRLMSKKELSQTKPKKNIHRVHREGFELLCHRVLTVLKREYDFLQNEGVEESSRSNSESHLISPLSEDGDSTSAMEDFTQFITCVATEPKLKKLWKKALQDDETYYKTIHQHMNDIQEVLRGINSKEAENTRNRSKAKDTIMVTLDSEDILHKEEQKNSFKTMRKKNLFDSLRKSIKTLSTLLLLNYDEVASKA